MKIFDKEQLLNNKTLAFLTPIEYSEEYFKLLNRNTNLKEISISHTDYENVNILLNNLINKDIKIIFWVQDFNSINKEDLLKLKNKENVYLKVVNSRYDIYEISLEKYLYYEKLLDLFVYDIKKSSLSNLEKIICAHTIVKYFKEYKDEPRNESYQVSRNLYEIFDSEYMVCVGFDNLYEALLKRLGITNTKDAHYYLDDDGAIEAHQRRILYFKDDKYSLEGVYLSDPTWDNDEGFNHDYFVHLLLTEEEIEEENYVYERNYHSVFASKSVEDVKEALDDERAFVVLMNTLEKVLPDKYDYLNDNYLLEMDDISYEEFKITKSFQEFINELFKIIIKYFKNRVSHEVILDAYKSVDRFIYNDERVVEELYNIRKKDNEILYEKEFLKKL